MSKTTPKITGLIITLNEEKNIKDVIENISFVDEIIILDSFSSDSTLDIAKSFPNVKIYQNKFKNFTDQRNLALDYASHNWILFLDADERLTDELRNEIVDTVKQKETAEAYFFYRKFTILSLGRPKQRRDRAYLKVLRKINISPNELKDF